MSEMIERVAKAIFPVEWAGVLFHEAAGNAEGVSQQKSQMLRKARAAIAAMLEPTEAMVLAAVWEDGEATARAVWRGMIDEAMNDTKTS